MPAVCGRTGGMRPSALVALGTWLARHPWRVIAAWVVVLVAASPLAATLPGQLRAEANGMPGTDSLAVETALKRDFDGAPGEPWVVAWRGERAGLTRHAAIAATAARLRALPEVAEVFAPTDAAADPRLAAADGRGACLLVAVHRNSAAGLAAVRAAVAPLQPALAAYDPTVRVGTTGAFPLGQDLNTAAGTDSARAERLLLAPVLLLLLWVFGSPLAALLPLVLAVAASVLAIAAGACVAGMFGINGMFLTVVSMLGLALGIDYALLVTARYRERRRLGDDPATAAGAASGTAGRTVACAGGVVVASLSALLPLGLMDARSVGLGGVLVVLAAVVLALGLLPALLALADPWLDWPRRSLREPTQAGRWQAWGAMLARTRWVAAPLAVAGLVWLAVPLGAFKPGVPDMRFYPAELEAVQAIAILDEMGRSGWTDPVQILVRRRDGGPILGAGGLGPMLALSKALHADPRVAEVFGPVDVAPGLSPLGYAVLYARPADAMARYPALGRFVSRDGRSAAFQVICTNAADVSGAIALTREIRGWDPAGLALQVGGLAALNIDYDARLQATAPAAVAWLLFATALILGVMFRSVLIPLKAIALNLLVVAASLGTLVWVFQLGHGATLFGLPAGLGTLPALIPFLVFCLTFGLSMDYEIFMIGRVREERAAGDGEGAAIARGLAATGWVIVAAAGIMIGVCGAFVGAHMIFVKLFGAGMALAILLDVTIVRLVLAPALLAIAGRWNWWPGDGEARSDAPITASKT